MKTLNTIREINDFTDKFRSHLDHLESKGLDRKKDEYMLVQPFSKGHHIYCSLSNEGGERIFKLHIVNEDTKIQYVKNASSLKKISGVLDVYDFDKADEVREKIKQSFAKQGLDFIMID